MVRSVPATFFPTAYHTCFDFFETEAKGIFFMSRYRNMLNTKASRWLLAFSVLLLLALFFFTQKPISLTHAASAHAQVPAQLATTSHCGNPGILLKSYPMKEDNGTVIGELDVYYNSSTGYNCAYTKAKGPTYGVSKYMLVQIQACAETSESNMCTTTSEDYDEGNFSYYAGPVAVHAPGHCIFAFGEIKWNGSLYETDTLEATFCG